MVGHWENLELLEEDVAMGAILGAMESFDRGEKFTLIGLFILALPYNYRALCKMIEKLW